MSTPCYIDPTMVKISKMQALKRYYFVIKKKCRKRNWRHGNYTVHSSELSVEMPFKENNAKQKEVNVGKLKRNLVLIQGGSIILSGRQQLFMVDFKCQAREMLVL